jgi:N-acetylglucosaminyl-diphospho-decaprenol L-rhamnosyltransferase
MNLILSIIIVNWNTRDLLVECLSAIADGIAPLSPAQVETIVVDNASTDDSVALVRKLFPWVRLLQNSTNIGFAGGNNQALQQNQGRYCLLLNSDTVVSAGSLAIMVEFMEQHPTAGAVGAKLLNPDGSFQASYAAFPTLWSEFCLLTGLARWTIGQYAPSPPPYADEAARLVDWVSGASLMVRRAALDQIGFMDEGYFMYSEETDLCWRLKQRGWQIWYVPDALIIHVGGASTSQMALTNHTRLYQSKLRFFRKNYGLWQACCLGSLLLVFSGVKLCVWRVLGATELNKQRKMIYAQKSLRERSLMRGCWSAATFR